MRMAANEARITNVFIRHNRYSNMLCEDLIKIIIYGFYYYILFNENRKPHCRTLKK